ncbi:DUF929 family protein [Nocardioides acrostichi]|uniref:DUF929 family protein n=1 Tax=Nocardioides acrostichi TaxID=2784339 RepID=A0A930UWQ3_9ACTN|nr:DUF929 family protein [Nocardioides acrostichi]MBF4161546.1 DUF929 family protein [Nocardioides acrostichi]
MARKQAKSATRRTEAATMVARQRARERRRSRLMLASFTVVALVIVGSALVGIGLHRHAGASQQTGAASADVLARATGVSASAFDQVGAGTAQNPPSAIQAPALTQDDKPRVLYVGAEYCPYCAAERWAVVAALSRFGTFEDLGQTASAHDDVYPDTSTLSFHGSSYTSKYLAFTGVETSSNQRQGNGYAPLDTLSKDDEKTFGTYDQPPYVSGQAGSIPFIDLGGAFVSSGASLDPGLLAGMSHEQVAEAMNDPSSEVGQAILGSANVFSAAFCRLTDGQPGSVCDSAGVEAAAAKLGS